MSDEQKDKMITLDQILHNDSTYTVYVESLDGYVTLRYASSKDRMKAHQLATRHPAWNEFTSEEKNEESARMLMLLLLVEPEISYEDYLKTDNIKMQILLAGILDAYTERLTELFDKRSREIDGFLGQMMEEPLKNSSNSSNSETSIGKEQQKSGKT